MTSFDLLKLILDYKHPWEWKDKQSEPAQVRLKQIVSLAEAFGISKTFANPDLNITYSGKSRSEYLKTMNEAEYVIQGEFLRDMPEQGLQKLKKKVEEILERVYTEQHERFRQVKDHDLEFLFTYTMNYRLKMYGITYHKFRGMMEGFSSGLFYSFRMQREINLIVEENMGDIDRILSMILDPEEREIPLQTLIDKHKYPNVDLAKIDLAYESDYY